MAENKADQKPEDAVSIEDLAKKNKVDPAVLAGLKVSKNWGTGKQVKEVEFLASLKSFLDSPADGRKIIGKPAKTEKKEGAK